MICSGVLLIIRARASQSKMGGSEKVQKIPFVSQSKVEIAASTFYANFYVERAVVKVVKKIKVKDIKDLILPF